MGAGGTGGVRREGFGSGWCGSVRYGSGRFDTILGESIVETAMVTAAHLLQFPFLRLDPES